MKSSNKTLEVKKRRRYDAEFKQNALQLIADGRSVNSVSESLGVSANLLYTWRSQSKQKDGVTTKEKEEQIKALQRQVKELERERDILKKALSIFSRPT